MPFKSKAQKGFLYANHPDIAKKFQEETPKGKKLPEHAKKKKPNSGSRYLSIRKESDDLGSGYT